MPRFAVRPNGNRRARRRAGARFAAAMRVHKWAVAALAVLVAGCGGTRQDADEPSGQFHVRVTRATFPADQSLSQEATLRIEVRNADKRTLPNVAVTVETRPEKGADAAAPEAFGAADTADTRLADDARPVWVVDRGPQAGQSAYANTWAMGSMFPGQTRSFVWHLMPAKAGRYTVSWRVSPGLDGKARAARGERTRGSFDVTIANRPVPATVDDDGNVVRGAAAEPGS
jgi:hypothetical protein